MIITAHSGCDGTRPNSLEYVRRALMLPVDALEVDVRRGSDGIMVLSHNPIGKDPVVCLDEAFQHLADTRLKINCDLKEYGLEDAVYQCAYQNGIDRGRIILTGSVTDCTTFLTRNPASTVFINAEELIRDFYRLEMKDSVLDELIDRCKESGYTVININYRVCSENLFMKCIESNTKLSLWTVDDEEAAKRLMQYKAAIMNVTTNAVKVAEVLANSAVEL